MKEPIRIVTNAVLRDERTERQVQELNRARVFYFLILYGAILMIIALL